MGSIAHVSVADHLDLVHMVHHLYQVLFPPSRAHVPPPPKIPRSLALSRSLSGTPLKLKDDRHAVECVAAEYIHIHILYHNRLGASHSTACLSNSSVTAGDSTQHSSSGLPLHMNGIDIMNADMIDMMNADKQDEARWCNGSESSLQDKCKVCPNRLLLPAPSHLIPSHKGHILSCAHPLV